MKKICVITGSRSDYGLLYGLMRKIEKSERLELKIIAIASHLSAIHGFTFKEIEDDGFIIHKKIECILSSDSDSSVIKSMGVALLGLSDALTEMRPDFVLLLGDRYEIFCAATASLVAKIPIGHIHGGEVTLGSIDDSFRHSISKMSNFHFCAADEYRRRIIQMGELPRNVYTVGALGVENIQTTELLTRNEIKEKLKIDFNSKFLLISIHPVAGSSEKNKIMVLELLKSLDKLIDTTFIITSPNADESGMLMNEIIKKYVNENDNAHYFSSLGRKIFLSLLSQSDGIIGNSSSAIIEAPSLLKGSINIGDRQTGRLFASSIINCEAKSKEISKSIKLLYSQGFQKKLKYVLNPYHKKDTSKSILEVLNNIQLSEIRPKIFFDLES